MTRVFQTMVFFDTKEKSLAELTDKSNRLFSTIKPNDNIFGYCFGHDSQENFYEDLVEDESDINNPTLVHLNTDESLPDICIKYLVDEEFDGFLQYEEDAKEVTNDSE